jgi:hypothetical protein
MVSTDSTSGIPMKRRNFLRFLISRTTKAKSTEKNMATTAILIACSADATGVIPFFESSCLILRLEIADKTLCKSNHFGSLGSTIKGECIVSSKLYSPLSTINFAVYYRLNSYFVRLKSVLLSDLRGMFPDHEIRGDSAIVECKILEGVKAMIFRCIRRVIATRYGSQGLANLSTAYHVSRLNCWVQNGFSD